MKWFHNSKNKEDTGKISIRFSRYLAVCLVLTVLLLICGSVVADNGTGANTTSASDLNMTVSNATANGVADIQAITTSANQGNSDTGTVDTGIPVIRAQSVPLPPVDPVMQQQFIDHGVMVMRNFTAADREAAAERAAAQGLKVGSTTTGVYGITSATNLSSYPGGTPDYFGPYPNYANSQLPVIDQTGKVIPGTGIRKFIDSLPGLGPAAANNLGQYIPVAVPDTTTYAGSDYYEIALVQYAEKMHSDLPPTTLRGYVQLETPVNAGTSKHIVLTYPNSSPIMNGGVQVFAYDNPHYLGPVIISQQNRPVRVKFHNYLATGTDGNFFLPVDTTVMGAGLGPLGLNATGDMMYSENRATLHLHGGNTPWISDGTPHQWTTPAGESTSYPEGVSVHNVPDMDNGTEPVGTLTFYYTNQQSARLLFYHDHAYGITRLGVYSGEAAPYVVRDAAEQNLINTGVIPGLNPTDEIPLVIQDKTFVPSATQMAAQDPTWNWGGNKSRAWPNTGDLWFPHVYMPNQNPGDISGANAMGRWDYGPWTFPPFTGINFGPVANPYVSPSAPWEPALAPATPNPSIVPEAFMDTMVVNGAVYPYLQVGAKAYRFRILDATNDRYLNLQLYYAGSNATMWSGSTLLNGSSGEVKMVPALPNTGLPASWPTDGRDGGVPDPNSSGPSWIQIGSEGGFLPAPAVIPPQPISYDYNRRVITVLNVNNHSLYLGPAERADVIVDFSGIPSGTKLILYNDAPAPNPAFDPRYDYYTNDPDYTSQGGAPTTHAGYGPNTRTIMQIQVNTALGTSAPYNLAGLNTALPAAYGQTQPKPLMPVDSYNTAFNASYPADTPTSQVYPRLQDNTITFIPTDNTTAITMDLMQKSIVEDFDVDYGRMNAMLGGEMARITLNNQTTIPYYFIDPPTDVLMNTINITPIGTAADGTQFWKIVHNGVDTHAIHFHMFNVQVLDRVRWDGSIRLPDANELGWKDTVKMDPLENVYLAARPIKPNVPWDLPNSIRPLDVTSPLGSAAPLQFHGQDPAGEPAPVVNHIVNFGWEYVWHCHLLGHEENDMMRPMPLAVAPNGTPSGLIAGNVVDPATNTTSVFLAWIDNSISETDWTVQRFNSTTNNWTDIVQVPSVSGPQINRNAMAIDSTIPPNMTLTEPYRVMATNIVGDTTEYAAPAIGYPHIAVNSTPSGNATPTTGTPPVAVSFNATPRNGNASLTVAFTGTATGATGWSWNFGDGDITNATGIQNPIHTYLNNGSYNVTFTAMSIGGNTSVNQTSFIVVGPSVPSIAPIANFTAQPIKGAVPLTVQFIDQSVNATGWNWTFGDNWSYGNVTTSNSTLTDPTHTYIQAGLYNVTLMVTNSGGSNVTTKTQYINVTNATDKIGVFRPSTHMYYRDSNGNGLWNGAVIDQVSSFGATGDIPVSGDWNADGRTEIGVFRNSTHLYYRDYNGNGVWDGAVIDQVSTFGITGDIAVSGDWNADGRTKIGVFRPSTHMYYRDYNGNGTWDGAVIDRTSSFGITGDIPVSGDWNADGRTEIGVFRPSTHLYYRDYNGNGVWDGAVIDRSSSFGITGDIPVSGDWNADGRTEIGVFRPSTRMYYRDFNGNGIWDGAVIDRVTTFGATGDIPVSGKWA